LRDLVGLALGAGLLVDLEDLENLSQLMVGRALMLGAKVGGTVGGTNIGDGLLLGVTALHLVQHKEQRSRNGVAPCSVRHR